MEFYTDFVPSAAYLFCPLFSTTKFPSSAQLCHATSPHTTGLGMDQASFHHTAGWGPGCPLSSSTWLDEALLHPFQVPDWDHWLDQACGQTRHYPCGTLRINVEYHCFKLFNKADLNSWTFWVSLKTTFFREFIMQHL